MAESLKYVKCAEGSANCMQTWERICVASRIELDAIYQCMDVQLLWRGVLPQSYAMTTCEGTESILPARAS